MRFRYLAGLGLAVAFATPAEGWSQTVQTFEDLTPCQQETGVYGDQVGIYGSVNYNSQFACYGWEQPPFTAHSTPNRIYASSGLGTNENSGTFNFIGGPVTFNGAWFAGSDINQVSFALFLGGVPVWSSLVLATSDVPQFLASGYGGNVDEVRVIGSTVSWVMDDVTFGAAVGPVVPEPASIILLGTGLVGVFGIGRLRRNRTL